MKDNRCKTCRRFKQKLFLKGEKCFSAKCPMIKKPYPPGGKKSRQRKVSSYGEQLIEKQKLRAWYGGLKEKKMLRYVKKALKRRERNEDAGEVLIQILERRLDNVVYRLGFADSKNQAHQLVIHRHFEVNGKVVDRPSYQVNLNDVVQVREKSKGISIFKEIKNRLKKKEIPAWVEIEEGKMSGKLLRLPTTEEVNVPVKISTVFEYYSR